MKQLGAHELAEMASAALTASRRRTHVRLHDKLSDPVQRVVIAMQPDSYVQPHRHADTVWELFVLLDGHLTVLTFEADGTVAGRTDLHADGDRIVQVPPGVRHTILAHASNTVVLEVKPGPYLPDRDKDFVSWAPPEGDAAAAAMLERLKRAEKGMRLAGAW